MITLSVDDQPAVTSLMKVMLTHIDPSGTHMTASDMEEALRLMHDGVQVVFLDIEMPGMSGLEAGELLKQRYKRLNIIYVTGHPEYSLEAHALHPSGFLLKPVCEEDILRELAELRFPPEIPLSPISVQTKPFAVFCSGTPFSFKRDRTLELFAYLVSKNGAFCTNDELLGVLWEGDPDKQGYLRQLILDLRESLREAGAEQLVIKKYGRIGIDTKRLRFEGERTEIAEEFLWI